MPELIKLLPEGSAVIAVIIVVLLFLKQQREQEKRLETITAAFNQRIGEIANSFQNQIDRLAKQIFDDKAVTQQQMERLFDGFMSVTKETTSALVEMRTALESVSRRLESFTRKQIPDKQG